MMHVFQSDDEDWKYLTTEISDGHCVHCRPWIFHESKSLSLKDVWMDTEPDRKTNCTVIRPLHSFWNYVFV